MLRHVHEIMTDEVSKFDIENVVKNFDRQKKSDEYASASESTRDIVSAVGTDTPLSVLIDIRHILSDICSNVREQTISLNNMQATMITTTMRKEESESERHSQLIAFLHKNSETTARSSSTQFSPSMSRMSLTPTIPESTKYFYRGDELKTPQSVIGCVMIHLETMISRALPTSRDTSDTNIMELKDWSSAITILRRADSRITPCGGALPLPKMSSTESKLALDLVASPYQGRAIAFKDEQMNRLISSCPSIMGCVEEIRIRALLCPGVITSLRLKHLSAVEFPYTTKDGDLNIRRHDPKAVGSTILHEKIRRMKISEREVYANLVLKDQKKPLTAADVVLNAQ